MKFQGLIAGVVISLSVSCIQTAHAYTVAFFNPSQEAAIVSSDVNSDTIRSNGYLFTYSLDKFFTGGVGMHGRPVIVNWPAGLQAQAVTAGPNIGTGAQITLRRADNIPFDLPGFSFKLLANTGGAGATLEIMPVRNGEDAFNDPLYFFASGYYGNVFSYDTTTPSYLGNTSLLTGYESYKIKLYVDFALVGLTLTAPVPNPADINGDGVVDLGDLTVIAAQWLGIPANPSADIAPDGGDGMVNLLDFAFLASQWQ